MPQESASLLSPYKGLIPYSEEDAQFFFGREELRDNILASMQAFRLTLLYGASGVGKSSVLRAGMVHRLRQLAAGQSAAGERPEFCVVIYSRWRDDPVTGLLNAVRHAVAQHFPNNPLLQTADTLSATLERWADEIQCDLFIVLDQFEEYFLYHPQEGGVGTFAHEFTRAVNNQRLRASFLISIREDALAKLDRFKARLPNIFEHALRVMPLRPEEARKAIEMPLTLYNELNIGARRVAIEPELVSAILRDVQTGAAVEGDWANKFGDVAPKAQIEAPYLQQVLTRLWTVDAAGGALRLDTYRKLGGGKQIVGSHLSNTIEQLDPSEQRVAARIFRYLVTPSGTKIAQTAEDLARYSELSPEEVTAVLGKLSGAEIRILRAVAPPPDLPGTVRYEIFHDVLAAPINAWWTVYEAREREEERLRQERETIAAESLKREQKAEARRYRRRLVWATGIAIVLGGVTVYAFTQGRVAVLARREADAAKVSAERSRDTALKDRDLAREANEKAVANYDEAKKAKIEAEEQRTNALAQSKAAEDAKADALKQKAVAVDEARRAKQAESKLSTANRDLNQKQTELTLNQRELERQIEEKNAALSKAEAATKSAVTAQAGAVENERIARKALEEVETAREREGEAREKAVRAIGLVAQADKQTPHLKGAMRGYGSKRSESPYDEASASGKGKGSGRDSAPVGDKVPGPKKTLSYLRNAAPTPDAKYVVTAGNDGSVRVWETDNPYKEPVTLKVPGLPPGEKQYHSITLAAGQKSDGESLVAATAYKGGHPVAVGVWTLTFDEKEKKLKPELVHTLEGHTGFVTALAFASDGNFLVSSSWDGSARVWNLDECTEEQPSCESISLPIHRSDGKPPHPIVSVAVSRDGKVLATGDTDGVTRLWHCDDASQCKAGRQLHKRAFAITSIDFSDDGAMLLTASEDGTARVWNLKDGGKEASLHERWEFVIRNKRFPFPFDFDWHGRKRPVMTGAAFIPGTDADPAPKFVVTSSEDGKVKVWDLETGTAVLDLEGHLGRVSSAAYSPLGKFFITAGEDDTVRIWEPCSEGWVNPKLGTYRARDNFRKYCEKTRAVSALSR